MTYYNTGTASVANGATTISFASAIMGTVEAPNFKADDLFMDPAQASIPPQRLASVDVGAATAELAVGWPGTSMTSDPYEVRYVDDIARSTAQTRRYLEMLGQLAAVGIQPNAFGGFSDRDAYDDAGEGFIFLSLDGDGDGGANWTLFIKLSGSHANWSEGQTAGGGGSTASIVPGNNIEVDSADPANPIVSLDSEPVVDALGINATPDGTNPLSATINKALFAAVTAAAGGDGDIRFTLSKETVGDLAGFQFQTDFSARAEFGLIGNDDFTIKISPDGSTWFDGLVIDKDDGKVGFPEGLRHAATGANMRNLLFTPGGDGQVSIWRSDLARSATPNTAIISSVAGDTITISTTASQKFGRFAGFMSGCSYVRIWNTSKVPEQSAWVADTPTTSTVQVLNAADVATWSNGETIRLGDPTSLTPSGAFAVDLSPMMQAVFGTVFRQSGALCRNLIVGTATQSVIEISEAGIAGSNQQVRSTADGTLGIGQVIIPCSVLSPISNSNLIFVRETGAPVTGGVSTVALFV